jgi:hypothetical protein
MNTTKPIFILGSGRSGTLALVQALMTSDEVEVHHEYLFENILSDAVLYFMGRLEERAMTDKLTRTHVAAVYYSKKSFWIDCSNALPWIVKPLDKLFPGAKFVLVIRNGRRVVSSFYHKFADVMYADDSVSALQNWLEARSPIKPPPEKKYWRPIPLKYDPAYRDFENMNRFERLCSYWSKINFHVHDLFKQMAPERIMTVKFEDLKSRENFEKLTGFIGIKQSESMFGAMTRPVNVHIPKTFPLTDDQEASFERLCGRTMTHFGYECKEDYDVDYHPDM